MAMGRKSKAKEWLQPEKIKEIEEMAASGMFEKDIAAKIGVARQTWFSWKNDFPSFSDAIKRGFSRRCQVAESSLNKLIKGYDYEETRTELTIKDDQVVGSKQITITKHVPPNLGAVIFFLTNANPEKWKNFRFNGEDEITEAPQDSNVGDWLKATKPTKKAVADLFANEGKPDGEQVKKDGETAHGE